MRVQRTAIFTFSAALLCVGQGVAQHPVTSLQAGVTPIAGESGLFELGARFSPRGPFGADVSIDVYPEYFSAAVLAGVADFSLAAHLPLASTVAIAPRVGVSLVGAVGSGGAIGAPGVSGGVGLVLMIDSRTSVRADYTYRLLMVGDETYPAPSLTAGFVILH